MSNERSLRKTYDDVDRYLPSRVVQTMLSKSANWLRAKNNPKSDSYDETFPQPYVLSGRALAWSEKELNAWLSTIKRKPPCVRADSTRQEAA